MYGISNYAAVRLLSSNFLRARERDDRRCLSIRVAFGNFLKGKHAECQDALRKFESHKESHDLDCLLLNAECDVYRKSNGANMKKFIDEIVTSQALDIDMIVEWSNELDTEERHVASIILIRAALEKFRIEIGDVESYKPWIYSCITKIRLRGFDRFDNTTRHSEELGTFVCTVLEDVAKGFRGVEEIKAVAIAIRLHFEGMRPRKEAKVFTDSTSFDLGLEADLEREHRLRSSTMMTRAIDIWEDKVTGPEQYSEYACLLRDMANIYLGCNRHEEAWVEIVKAVKAYGRVTDLDHEIKQGELKEAKKLQKTVKKQMQFLK